MESFSPLPNLAYSASIPVMSGILAVREAVEQSWNESELQGLALSGKMPDTTGWQRADSSPATEGGFVVSS
jgi:hypothetical protein